MLPLCCEQSQRSILLILLGSFVPIVEKGLAGVARKFK
jgi:hypothetical protein